MNATFHRLLTSCLFLLLALQAGCVIQQQGPRLLADKLQPGSGHYYTAANIWHERPDIWTINYKRGRIIPAGTEVSALRLMEGRSLYVEFTVARTNETFRIHLSPRHNPELGGEALLDRLFTRKDLARLTKGFTENEKIAIRLGQVRYGMSKAAVLVSWGYPPQIATPSLDEPTWIYWLSKFNRKAITFDQHDKVVHMRD